MSDLTFQHSITVSSVEGDLYSGEATIKTKEFLELCQFELFDLAQKCINALDSKNKSALFQSYNLYTKEEIKEEKGFALTNKDSVFVSSFAFRGLQFIDRTRKLTQKELETIKTDPDVTFFTEISVPDWIEEQINEYAEKKKKEKEIKEQEKLKRKIQKAQRLLREVGENVVDNPLSEC